MLCGLSSTTNHFTIQSFFFRTSICQEEKPLEFEDIVDKKTYDKMRPPKPEGMLTKNKKKIFFAAIWPPYRVDDGPNAAKYFIFLKRLLTLATTTKWWRFGDIPETLGFGSALCRNGFKPMNIELGIYSFLAKLCQRFGKKKWKKTY